MFCLLSDRIIGYASCSVFGFVLSIIGTLILIGGTSANNIRLFVIFYVIGAVIGMTVRKYLSIFISGISVYVHAMYARMLVSTFLLRLQIHNYCYTVFYSSMCNWFLVGSQSAMYKDVVAYSSMEHGLLPANARNSIDCSCAETEHILSLIPAGH